MSRDKQIEEMADKLCTTSYFCSTEDWDSCDIKDSDEYCHRCRKVAERLYNAGYRKKEWISVDERLPDKSDWYLVNIIDHFGLDKVTLTNYKKTFGWNVANVTHWMPLPEAPKMKGGAE